jgi:hypothetical protein
LSDLRLAKCLDREKAQVVFLEFALRDRLCERACELLVPDVPARMESGRTRRHDLRRRPSARQIDPPGMAA